MREMIEELDGKLSEAGWAQYDKYPDYYNDQYEKYGGMIDFVAFLETEAENGATHS